MKKQSSPKVEGAEETKYKIAPACSIPVCRIQMVKEELSLQSYNSGQGVNASRQVAEVVRAYLNNPDREHFVVLLLDTRNAPVGIHTVSIGSLSSSVVHPREVFKAALLANASAVVAAHNHPSGNVEPSKEDDALTHRLCESAKILGIRFLDHVIVGEEKHFSYADEGKL